MKASSLVGLLAAALACAPTRSEDTPAPTPSSARAALDEPEGAYTPRWHAGQTWGVQYDTFLPPMDETGLPIPTITAWRYEVVTVSDQGVAGIRATSLYPGDGAVHRFSYVYVIEVHESGQLVRIERKSRLPPVVPPPPVYPFVPYIVEKPLGTRHLVPWWPRFPLVPGETRVFFGGAVTQSVTEVDGTLVVELVAKPRDGDYPYRRVVMEWDRGRPYWTRIEEFEQRDDEPPPTPFRFRGKVVTWDRSNPWPIPRDVEPLEIVHPLPP